MLNKSFVDKLVSGASGQIHFMSKTIDDFRNFFKPSKSKGPVDVLEVVISAVKLMEAQMKHGGISLTVNNKTNTSSLLVFWLSRRICPRAGQYYCRRKRRYYAAYEKCA